MLPGKIDDLVTHELYEDRLRQIKRRYLMNSLPSRPSGLWLLVRSAARCVGKQVVKWGFNRQRYEATGPARLPEGQAFASRAEGRTSRRTS